MFGTILLSIITLMHIYVFWRAASVPFVKAYLSKKFLFSAGLLFWLIFYLGRVYGLHGTGFIAGTAELIGMNWMAALFLIFVCLLSIDIITGFGLILNQKAPLLRGLAIACGIALSCIALIQGLRPPVVEHYDVYLSDLPPEMEDTVLVAMSDLHLGSLIGVRWLEARIAQVNEQQPDLVLLLGDIFEGHGLPQDSLLQAMNRLSAPLGVWAVFGNHGHHLSNNMNTTWIRKANFTFLRNCWTEVQPGLILAGVDDLTAMRRSGKNDDFISKALSGKPPGVTILLSHTPGDIEKAANAGVGLMLCGHTHGGQIWPFDYLVKCRYPLLEGRYEQKGMTIIVCRGTGTWGPRMRLFSPGEILRVTLHREKD